MTLALRHFSARWFVSAVLIGICCGIPAPNAQASESFLDLVRLAQAGADADDSRKTARQPITGVTSRPTTAAKPTPNGSPA